VSTDLFARGGGERGAIDCHRARTRAAVPGLVKDLASTPRSCFGAVKDMVDDLRSDPPARKDDRDA
jgi:hypothetical protein